MTHAIMLQHKILQHLKSTKMSNLQRLTKTYHQVFHSVTQLIHKQQWQIHHLLSILKSSREEETWKQGIRALLR